MSGRFGSHIRSNVIGYLAIFLFAVAGTANAVDGSLPGQNTVGLADIIDGEVTAADIKAESIGSTKIADRQVKNADLSLGASSSNTIADGGVQSIDIKDETLTRADGTVAPGGVDRDEIQFDAVSGAEIESGTVMTSDLEANVIPADGGLGTSEGSSKLATDSVGRLELKGQSVDGGSVIDNTLGGLDILDESLTTVDISNKSLTSNDIQDGAIGSASIADGSVGRADISAPLPFASGSSQANLGDQCVSTTNCPLSRNYNVTSVTNPATGLYCIRASNVTSATAMLFAQAEGVQPGHLARGSNQHLATSSNCPDGDFELNTWNGETYSNIVKFSFVILP